jgi:hypothetical protein
MSAILKRTTGLGVDEDVQVEGYDARYWDIVHDLEPAAIAGPNGGDAVSAGGATPPPHTEVRAEPPRT